MELVQTDVKVTGHYVHDSVRILGKAIGSGLSALGLKQRHTSRRTMPAILNSPYRLIGKSFTGRWRYGSSGGWTSRR